MSKKNIAKLLGLLIICSFWLFLKEHFFIMPLIDEGEVTGVYIEFKIKL